jgi:hypothetical protein
MWYSTSNYTAGPMHGHVLMDSFRKIEHSIHGDINARQSNKLAAVEFMADGRKIERRKIGSKHCFMFSLSAQQTNFVPCTCLTRITLYALTQPTTTKVVGTFHVPST